MIAVLVNRIDERKSDSISHIFRSLWNQPQNIKTPRFHYLITASRFLFLRTVFSLFYHSLEYLQFCSKGFARKNLPKIKEPFQSIPKITSFLERIEKKESFILPKLDSVQILFSSSSTFLQLKQHLLSLLLRSPNKITRAKFEYSRLYGEIPPFWTTLAAD